MESKKLDGNSFDVVADNIQKLKELFPEVVNGDNEVNIDALRDIFEEYDENIVTDDEEFYKFTWWGKKEAKNIAKAPTTKTLRPVKKDSKNWDSTENIYIEGDNLDALKILLGSYRNKIKMIYIDPPYNTGKDFVYVDKFGETNKEMLERTGQLNEDGFLEQNPKTDGKYHSKWLNMLYPRLKLAKHLLKDDGVIFISIDDNEVHNLKKMCDEIFGESNFACNFVWQSTPGSNTGTDIITVTENILVYTKNKKMVTFNGNDADESSYKNIDEYYERRGKYALDKLDSKRQSSHYSEALNYSIIMPDGTKRYPGGTKEKTHEGWNYLWSKTKVEWGIENGFIEFKKKNNDWIVYNKRYFKVDNKDNLIERTIPFRNVIFSNQFTTAQGTGEIRNLFGSIVFDYPKSSLFVKYLLKTCVKHDKSSVILDFFSGSASTAHALMDLNNEDGGNRNFIMVQLPEKTEEKSNTYKEGYPNICEMAKERIRRAGDKIVEESGNKDLDIGFKVFKVDETNFIPWDTNLNKDNIEQAILNANKNLVSGRSELDLVYELLLKLNLDLNSSIDEIILDNNLKNKIYVVRNGFMFICLDDNLSDSIADDLICLKNELKSSYSQVVLKDSALDDNNSINIYETLDSENVEFYTI